MDQRIERLGDEQAIRDTLARYWRGVDRRDAALVASTYHDDAYDDHGYYKGPVAGFIESLRPGVWDFFENTQHFSGHIAVDFLTDDRARAESYAEAHHIRAKEEGGHDDLVFGLRYVDLFERRADEWRIAHRVCIWDWHRIDDGLGMPLPESYFRGHHSKEDPVYEHPRSIGTRVSAEDLIKKQACYDTLMRYARGVDRCDPDLVASTYFDDAYDDHGGYQGPAPGFVEWVQPTVMNSFTCTMHKLGNNVIEIDGDRAFAETYAVAHHVQAEIEAPTDMIMGVRYIDRLECRAGEWRIAHRVMSFEWERSLEVGSQARRGAMARGRRDGLDPVLAASRSRVSVPGTISEVADRAEIHSVVARYCRGVDRRDESLVRSAYHPDAIDDRGVYEGGVDGLIEHLRKEVTGGHRTTMHKLGQVLVEVDGDEAESEAYAICHHIQAEAGRDVTDHVIGVRFLDRLSRRAGRWAIAKREVRFEWIRSDGLEPLDPDWTHGSADALDPVFATGD